MTETPRLEVRVQREGGLACLFLSGVIDERFDAATVLREVAPLTILEVSGIRRITSFGVRQWSEAMKALPNIVRHLYLVRCPPVFVDQLSMVLNFGGRSEVVSAYATYVCDKCGKEAPTLLDLYGDRPQLAAGQLPEATCADCKLPMQLSDDPQLYVRLVNEFGAKTLEPEAALMLDRTSLHATRKLGRQPEATKLVHGQVTLFRLTGTLDGRFRMRRLAAGVEGDVVFDLGEIEGLDATGAERWRELLGELSSAISVTLVDVPQVVLAAIASGSFTVGGAGLYSYQASFQCADCGNLETRPLRADEPLAACTRSCGRCGRTALPATDVALIEQVFQHARPASVSPAIEEMIRTRHEILERAGAESGRVSVNAPGDSLARYRVLKPLTEGGMAEIFLAVNRGIAGFEKLVVLKKILRKMLERRQVAVQLFLNEAKIAANLSHPNIVQTFEVGEHGGDLFIAMEYIHGIDVRRLLRQSVLKDKLVPVEQILYIAERTAAALHHAHTAKDLSGRNLNIVHRDVSPSNILLGFDGQVKLLDFGVASASVGESFDGLFGKFSYMSPEQLAREPMDGRSDVFALGVVLHEMLSRKPLFRREKDEETIRAVLRADIPSLAAVVPPYVEAVIKKALARNRDERYTDARAFQVAIDECIRKLGNTPTTEQVALTLTGLFPDQSAAPAFDPSLYRSSGSDVPSPTPSFKSGPGSGTPSHEREPTANAARDNELTLVNNDSNVSDIEAQRSSSERSSQSPQTPAPKTPAPKTPAPLSPLPQTRPPLTPPPSTGLNMLPPVTPAPMALPHSSPHSLSPSTPLPAALAAALQPRQRSAFDYWLIAAAVAIFIIGFLLVVF